MNRNRLLLIGVVALALGSLVSFGVYQKLQQRSAGDAQVGWANVVVASKDIQLGDKVNMTSNVKLARFPEGELPKGVYHNTADVHEFGVILPIARGEFVLPNKLATKEAGSGLAALIPAGMRAVPVRANDVVSIAGFVQPGSRVDVLVTATPTGGDEQQTTTVLENVLVLANGTQLERDASGRAQNAPVITLAVSPDDAQKLTLASTEGRIQLALRNPTDTRPTDLGTVSTRSLFRLGAIPVAPRQQQPSRPRVKPTTTAPPPPSKYSVEIYRGAKKDKKTFPE